MTNKSFVLLDFDRTLVDTNALKAAFDEIMERLGAYQASEIRAKLAIDPRFETYDFLEEKYGREEAHRLVSAAEEEFVKIGNWRQFWNEGAAELLLFLQQNLIGHGILSWGNSNWQLAKIQAAGMDNLPCLITKQKEKGKLIASWWTGAGYKLPAELGGGVYQKLLLIDDRWASFDGAPSDLLKIYYNQQFDALSDDVVRIDNLRQAIDLIKNFVQN